MTAISSARGTTSVSVVCVSPERAATEGITARNSTRLNDVGQLGLDWRSPPQVVRCTALCIAVRHRSCSGGSWRDRPPRRRSARRACRGRTDVVSSPGGRRPDRPRRDCRHPPGRRVGLAARRRRRARRRRSHGDRVCGCALHTPPVSYGVDPSAAGAARAGLSAARRRGRGLSIATRDPTRPLIRQVLDRPRHQVARHSRVYVRSNTHAGKGGDQLWPCSARRIGA